MVDTGFDFRITDIGELAIDSTTKSIATVSNDDKIIQNLYCRASSVSHDWFLDNIGANLEELAGMPFNKDTVRYGEDKLVNSFLEDDYITRDSFSISTELGNNLIHYIIRYFNHTEKLSYWFDVRLDLIYGITIDFKKLEGDNYDSTS